ncbi:uncharacterized protein THITE_2145727 [Thermothielavioides terrestris NRRL 8126]|uniref:Major facilitator superfamily (MFS) profile domain-containing protein n=1 Tax=Thermothielavioides terrestris (strain ATCC 38088 / NRRL 8126) TaxID=578455 RepID=G2R922_THETT|nr:uncharacterized protein THITE_2145727 [Thermothielavioides terrestris NRRL 8126]AEO68617.1 hypothetical protein THITE_2145727 [Thermothielavioides terrestris NRRL 8126]
MPGTDAPAESEKPAAAGTSSTSAAAPADAARPKRRPARFWMVIVALSLLAFITSLDAMILFTALPTITAKLDGSAVYVWIANCFVFAATAVQPLVGQLADILGRKVPTVVCVALFTLGSGIAGGAANPAMFIAGRSIQGIGAGGIYLLIDIIACDLVLLRDRGKWLGIINYGDLASSIASLDVVGNLIFIPSIIAALIGLVTGGVVHPWSSFRHFIARNPGVPSRLFGNRTSAGGYVLMFLSSVLMQTAGYFLPVYFQAVLGTTVMDSGVYFLPFAIGTLFAAAVGGVLMSHLGVYRPIHVAAFALSAVGFGLFTLLGPDTPKVAWAWYELVTVIGLGPTISTVLPAILAGLPQSDVAAATAVFSFIKTFGFVWGVSIPSIIFNGVVDDSVPAAHGLAPTVNFAMWSEVVQVYVAGLKAVWWWGVALSILGVFAVAIEDHLPLSTELETEYGLREGGAGAADKDRPAAVETGSAST